MKPPRFAYHDPATVEEALDLLARHGDGARLLAGGQSLVPMLNFRLARPAHLVDINRLTGLAAEDFFVAALTTAMAPDELLTAIVLPAWPARTGSSLQEVAIRRGDFALGGVAATLTLDAAGRVAAARIVCFGVGPRPLRARDA